MRLAALLHDAAKPATRGMLPDGRVTFIGHDRVGAELARDVLTRLRSSERLRDYVAALTRHHLALGFLVHERPISRRAAWRYLRATAPYAADVTILTVADRLATRGKNAEPAIGAHVALARDMLALAFAEREAGPRPPLVRGDELARELGLAPGPEARRAARPARGGPLRGRDRHPRAGARPRAPAHALVAASRTNASHSAAASQSVP